jgi:PIN domain nuclease of toxin-antitoxin system
VRILIDTSIWFQYARNLALPKTVEAALDETNTRAYLSPISSMEIIRKWKTGKLACADPVTWIDNALEGFELLPITEAIARQAALWNWEHRDPADRLIAATAQIHSVELWHSDTVLKALAGFPQRYFKAPAITPRT